MAILKKIFFQKWKNLFTLHFPITQLFWNYFQIFENTQKKFSNFLP